MKKTIYFIAILAYMFKPVKGQPVKGQSPVIPPTGGLVQLYGRGSQL